MQKNTIIIFVSLNKYLKLNYKNSLKEIIKKTSANIPNIKVSGKY